MKQHRDARCNSEYGAFVRWATRSRAVVARVSVPGHGSRLADVVHDGSVDGKPCQKDKLLQTTSLRLAPRTGASTFLSARLIAYNTEPD